MAEIFQCTIQDRYGNIVPGASVEVRDEATNAIVPLFSDDTLSTGITNPFAADADGYAFFYAADGLYKVTTFAAGFEQTWRDVRLSTGGGIGSDADAIHGNVSAEISAIALKATPVSADLLLIEDSAASNTKKRVKVGSLPSGGGGGGRELLTAARTYYVRTDGNDANTGLLDSAAGAFLTIQKAWDVIVSTLDQAGFAAVIQIGDGTYSAGITGSAAPTGPVTINGNISTIDAVVIDAASVGFRFEFSGPKITLQYVKIQAGAIGLYLIGAGLIFDGRSISYGACGTNHCICDGCTYTHRGDYNITGGAGTHLSAQYRAKVTFQSGTATLTGTPAFPTGFVYCGQQTFFQTFSLAFSGAATGRRYQSVEDGFLKVWGGGVNLFPGDIAGFTSDGGQYI